MSRKQILEEVWGLHEDTDTRAIDNFVVRLRRYIEDDPGNPRHLLTVRGVGTAFWRSRKKNEIMFLQRFYARHSSASSVSRRWSAMPSMRRKTISKAESRSPRDTRKSSVAIQRFL